MRSPIEYNLLMPALKPGMAFRDQAETMKIW